MLSRTLGAWPTAVWRRFRRSLAPPITSLLVVEHRDEVFARLAGDLLEVGLFVQRAATPLEAHDRFADSKANLIVVHRDLIEEGGWLMASKWARRHPNRQIWLYAAWPSALDEAWARFTKVDRILYCQGNVWSLAKELIAQLSLTTSARVENHPRRG